MRIFLAVVSSAVLSLLCRFFIPKIMTPTTIIKPIIPKMIPKIRPTLEEEGEFKEEEGVEELHPAFPHQL